MWISDISIRRPVFATMVIMSFMVLGIVSMTRLGIDLFPDVSFPFVNISGRLSRRVARGGRDARHQADRGCRRRHQRRQAGRVALDRRRSRASASSCASKWTRRTPPPKCARRWPRSATACREEIEDPTIVRFDVAGAADHDVRGRLVAALRHDPPPDRRRPEAAARADRRRRRGRGQRRRVREIQVDLDPGRLEALGLPVSVVAEKLAAENLDLPGGRMTREGQTHLAAHQGRVRDRRKRSRASSCARTAARPSAFATSAAWWTASRSGRRRRG